MNLREMLNAIRPYVLGWISASFVPLSAPLTSVDWDGDSFSTIGKTVIDLSTVFGVPDRARAVLVKIAAKDSASATTSCFIALAPNATVFEYALVCKPYQRPNDDNAHASGVVPCDANGDIYYEIVATGAGTFDVVIQIWGYWL